MKHRFYILISIVIILLIISYSWWKQALKPVNPHNSLNTIFIIEKGENIRSIADRLQKQDLIRSSVAFFLFSRITNLANEIQAGEFVLNKTMTMPEVAEILKHGTIDTLLTIPEGWRNEEIALKLTQEFGIPEQEFLKKAKEGYMFPDTYKIPRDITAEAIIKIFKENFNNKVNQDLINKAGDKNINLNELIIIASLVEREAKYPEDRPMIASVILNRLRSNIKLDIDATIQFALGYQTNEKSWWKKNLTFEDLTIESPYNTYIHEGLPPGPISNPGLAAIKSVIDAPSSDYLFYLSDNTGKTHFTKSLDEHNINISKYLHNLD
ncbi:hypothetical protein A2Y99_03400 [Candidatus Gottesmanbacteria bacterium RBG_13_37_7]|uniref:Endolytic murein transglycosylase n=1 Tax=Candidatus Gottesmanbacteria bacterium RBG_13_37_7 TaxID=1798369 RepID=A0A1F5YJ44_9BACT|nr:MAG: hypothetical protein A2Y99_03400 [Candidatus Gottesmanbacteria bacterium RBG_13_37_7]